VLVKLETARIALETEWDEISIKDLERFNGAKASIIITGPKTAVVTLHW
jgi:hypothetical protein